MNIGDKIREAQKERKAKAVAKLRDLQDELKETASHADKLIAETLAAVDTAGGTTSNVRRVMSNVNVYGIISSIEMVASAAVWDAERAAEIAAKGEGA